MLLICHAPVYPSKYGYKINFKQKLKDIINKNHNKLSSINYSKIGVNLRFKICTSVI